MFYTQSELTERGWTKGLISIFLPNPDETKKNPRYKCAAPMKLYSKDRVTQIEASESFKEALNKTQKRVKAAHKATKTKLQKTLQMTEEFSTDVKALSKADLIELACEHYNDRRFLRDWASDSYADPNSDESFLNRICVNYLRHVESEYESSLCQIRGKVGVDTAYMLIKNKTLEKISIQYPWLTEECKRQGLTEE